MSGATNFTEEKILNTFFRRNLAAISGSNSSTTNILVASNTGFSIGCLVKGSVAGSYHLVTAIPDSTHITVTPAFAAAPTTGNLELWAYSPAAVYIILFSANPTDAGGGTEVSGGNYTRKQLVQADSTFGAPSGSPRVIANSSIVEWTGVTWAATVTGWGLIDTSSGSGNLLMWFDSVDVIVSSGGTVRFAAGNLSISND